MKPLLIIGFFLALTPDNLWVSAVGVLLMSIAALILNTRGFGYE